MDIWIVKFLSSAGLSRRRAYLAVKNGEITVNGKVMLDMSFRVTSKDTVFYNGKKLKLESEAKLYFLLHKPVGYITTCSDESGRQTVMDFVKKLNLKSRIFPVGRLDKETSGLLPFTNDGDWANNLLHPSFEREKEYKATLDKNFLKSDATRLKTGLLMRDGPIAADKLSYRGKLVTLSIHSGRNRIVRRVFKKLGYNVLALHRISFSGMQVKKISVGEFLQLTESKAWSFLK